MAEIRRRKPALNTRIERQIITGMIVSDRFIREIRPLCEPGDLQTDFAARVAEWCYDYHDRYKTAIGQHVEDLYHTNKNTIGDAEAALIEEFLLGISNEYESEGSFNDEYILDKAEKYFRLNAIKRLRDELDVIVINGEVEEGEQYIKEFTRPGRPKNRGIDPLRDVDAIVEALRPTEENPDVILTLPGALGKMCGPMEREFLVGIQAESGVGKTWWLWWMAQLAALQFGHNVAFFSMELSVLKMIQRIWPSITGCPLRPQDEGRLLIPVFDCGKNQDGTCPTGCVSDLREGSELTDFNSAPPDYVPCTNCRGTSKFFPTSWWRDAGQRELLDAGVAIKKHMIMDRGGVLKRSGRVHLTQFPSGKYDLDDVNIYLNNLEYYDDFIPSMIITDYADKLKWGIPGDPRNSIGQIWNGHKSMAVDRHCLVVTASQSNTMRSKKTVGRASWGETQEKEHVLDLGIALNQSAQEQARDVMNASIAKMRHNESRRTDVVTVLQKLAIGRPYVDSCRKLNFTKK